MTIRTRQRLSHLGEMLEDVRGGHMVPAAFQRPYVWGRGDVEEMWTSIASNDPLGGLLLWEPEDRETAGLMSRSHLGPIPVATGADSRLILDGQNRLVSLAWSTIDPSTAPSGLPGCEVWQTSEDLILVADHAASGGATIRFVPRREATGMTMPIWKLFDNRAFNSHVVENWSDDVDVQTTIEWLASLQTCVREARVVVSTIEGGDAEQAKRRFLRMARVGVPMSAEDFDAIARTV